MKSLTAMIREAYTQHKEINTPTISGYCFRCNQDALFDRLPNKNNLYSCRDCNMAIDISYLLSKEQQRNAKTFAQCEREGGA